MLTFAGFEEALNYNFLKLKRINITFKIIAEKHKVNEHKKNYDTVKNKVFQKLDIQAKSLKNWMINFRSD